MQKKSKKYRRWLNYNKELLIGELGAFIGGPLLAQLSSFFFSANIIIAFMASVGDYLSYTFFYALASFSDNKNLYWNKKKKKVKKSFFRHLMKFILGAAFVDVIYYSARTYVNYFILGLGWQAYMAAFVSQAITLVLYFLLMNLMGWITGIIQKKDISKD